MSTTPNIVPAAPPDRALLSARGVTVRFGGVVANHEIDIDVHEGELVGVIGPNGAGKTTLIDALCGFVPSQGVVHLNGRELTGATAARRARAGLVRTWQSVELFDDLTIAENLSVAIHQPRRFDLVRDLLGLTAASDHEAIESALVEVGLDGIGNSYPDQLSHGQRKLAGVARSLVTRPRVLLLDEPAAGLDETESRELGAQLRRLVGTGMTMLLVDHDMTLVLGICDRVYVIETGVVIAAGPPDEIRNNPLVLEAYLGSGHTESR